MNTGFGNIQIKKHRLTVGGCDCKALAERYGTPLYVFDVSRAEETAKSYVDILKREYPDFTVCYASKAFCCKGIYKILAPLGVGADVVSGGELFTALAGGMPANRIYFHGNNKTDGEIKYAIESGVDCFVVDSERELKSIARYADNASPQNVLVRVNPGVEAHTHRFIQTTLVDSKFGFSVSDGSAERIIKSIFNYNNIRFCGIACHIGSQIFETQSFEIAIDKLADFMSKLKAEGINTERLDIGGGYGIKYVDGDDPLTPQEYMRHNAVYLKSVLNEKHLPLPRLIVEPGRSIVGEAGITLYTVGAIKDIKDVKTYAAVDGGMFENPRPSLYDARYTAFVADRADADKQKTYSIAGKCCESGDVLIDGISLPILSEGDVLAVMSTGAYHYSMASNYNRNPVPPVVAVKNGKSCYMVKPQTYDDMARNDADMIFSEGDN